MCGNRGKTEEGAFCDAPSELLNIYQKLNLA